MGKGILLYGEILAENGLMSAAGDFSIPMFIHATVPPGVETMKRLSKKVSYLVQNTDQGAEIRIIADDPETIQAVHNFLKFQIEDHRTGDPLKVQK